MQRHLFVTMFLVLLVFGAGCQKTQETREVESDMPQTPQHEQKTENKQEPPERVKLRQEFTELCPLPSWWDRVDAPNIKTYGELMRYWQDRTRTPEQFFKAAFRAMREYPDDEALFVEAAYLLSNGDPAYPYLDKVYEFTLSHYFEYRKPTVNYGGKPADSIAGIVRNYANILIGRGEAQKAIELIENLLNKRKDEINPHILQLLALVHARAYQDIGDITHARAILEEAKTYPGSWTERIDEELARLK